MPEDCPTPMEYEDGEYNEHYQPKAEECEHGIPYQYPCEICDRPEANSGVSSPALSPGQPEPESQESGTEQWNLQNGWEEIIHYGDKYVSKQEVIALLNAHGITPDSEPIDKERGRELLDSLRLDLVEDGGPAAVELAEKMRDWINQVCGEE